MRATIPRILALIGLIFLSGVSHRSLADDTADFQAALAALNQNNIQQFNHLAQPLHGYILYPYLRYAYLEHELRHDRRHEIDDFLKANAKLPISTSLKHHWLLELARRQNWGTFLAEDKPGLGGERLECARAEALVATDHLSRAIRMAKHLWLRGHSLPKSCDPAFDFLSQNELITPRLIHKRLLLAIEDQHIRLARYLLKKLPSSQSALPDRWIKLYQSPADLVNESIDQLGPPAERTPVLRAIFIHLAGQAPLKARRIWIQFAANQPHLSTHLQDRVLRIIALHAAWNQLPQARAWLHALPPASVNTMVRTWRARVALRSGDWKTTLKAIQSMPDWQRRKPAWRYWEARAMNTLGHPARAKKLARPLSKEFNYYGFLAARLLQHPYAKGKPLPPINSKLQHKVATRYLIRVALALKKADQFKHAEAAWRAALHPLGSHERLAAAELAYRHHWAYGAYAAAARAGIRDASRLMFPVAQMPHVQNAASRNDLKPGLLLAVMRQESAFQAGVCSDKGACGLLQLLPETACWISKQTGLGQKACNAKALAKPSVNILAGASYLAYLLKHFGHDAVLALAAYNAGPHAVSRWISTPSAIKPGTARWLATLPYGETRDYVKAVLFNRVVYARRLKAIPSASPTRPVKTRYTSSDTGNTGAYRLVDTLLPRADHNRLDH